MEYLSSGLLLTQPLENNHWFVKGTGDNGAVRGGGCMQVCIQKRVGLIVF